jgi:putative magnesium chelatase accessory protein
MGKAPHALDWNTDGSSWPNHAASRFIDAAGLRWHVQQFGAGPVLLLLHGTGASTHSWRDFAPLLAGRFHVIAPDLPGHAFTSSPGAAGLSMPAMARAVAALLRALGERPHWIVGHSAGAAVAARMTLDGLVAPQGIVSLNGALLPLGGMRHPSLGGLTRWLATGEWLPGLFARRAAVDPAVVERMLAQTGSRLDERGRELYRRLVVSPPHARAALSMMAMWDPRVLERDLPQLASRLELVVGSEDRMILPGEAVRVRALVPAARIHALPGLGHLAHEERPAEVAALVSALVAAPAPSSVQGITLSS